MLWASDAVALIVFVEGPQALRARARHAFQSTSERKGHSGDSVTLDLADLDRQLEALDPEDLAAAVIALSARCATLAARIGGAPPRRWMAAAKAAQGAGVEVADLQRWARRPGVTWASWPTKRTLLVDVEAFDRWLASGRFKREGARGRSKRPFSTLSSPTRTHEDDRTRAESA